MLQTREPQLLHFGVADETAWEVGLACGGTIEVFVQPLEEGLFQQLQDAVEGEYPAAEVTVIRGPASILGSSLLWSEKQVSQASFTPEMDREMIQAAQSALAGGQPQRMQLSEGTGRGICRCAAPISTCW